MTKNLSKMTKNETKSSAQKIIDSTPASADFALVVAFCEESKKDRATEEIEYVLNTVGVDKVEIMSTDTKHTSLILIGDGLFKKKNRRYDPAKIYEKTKEILAKYVSDSYINVQLYIDAEFFDNAIETKLVANRCVFTQTITASNPLDGAFETALKNEKQYNIEDFEIVTTKA